MKLFIETIPMTDTGASIGNANPEGERDARPKFEAQGTSMYFDRGYSPTDNEVDEMIAIRKDLQIGGINCYKSARDVVAALDEDNETDTTTKDALRSIFFPKATDVKSVHFKSEPVEIYTHDCKYDLKLFTKGFMFCLQPPSSNPQSKPVHGTKIFKRLGSWFDEKDEKNDKEDSKKGRVYCAFLLSDIDRVETLDVWKFKDIKAYLGGDNELVSSHKAFAIFIRERRSPFIVRCASKEDVESWVDTFRFCVSGQKDKVLGKNRTTVRRTGVVFGINNTRRLRSSGSERAFANSVQWDEDEDEIAW